MSLDHAELHVAPFDLLLELETRIRHARMDVAAGQAPAWVGLAFRLRDHWCVAPRDDVREVIIPPRLSRVPGTKPWLMGVANVRGNLLPVTDLGELVGAPHVVSDRANRVLVFNSDRIPAGFLVDEVAGYRQFVPTDQRHELVSDVPNLAPYLLGGFAREGRPWLVLSLRKLTSAPVFINAG
jgi:twitching motility protein PilI